MKSFIILIRHWGLVLVGIILAIGGLIYGSIPQTTPYQHVTKALIAHYLSGNGTGYMQLENSPTLYIVNESEFLPAFSAEFLNHGNVLISILYRTDDTTDIDASSDTQIHLKGTAYQVERITLYHQFGQLPEVYSTFDYMHNPNGYYQHYWTVGIALSLPGLICIGSGLFMNVRREKRKKQLDFSSAPAVTQESADKQPVQDNQYQEPGTVEYKEYSTQPSTISPVE